MNEEWRNTVQFKAIWEGERPSSVDSAFSVWYVSISYGVRFGWTRFDMYLKKNENEKKGESFS